MGLELTKTTDTTQCYVCYQPKEETYDHVNGHIAKICGECLGKHAITDALRDKETMQAPRCPLCRRDINVLPQLVPGAKITVAFFRALGNALSCKPEAGVDSVNRSKRDEDDRDGASPSPTLSKSQNSSQENFSERAVFNSFTQQVEAY